jgi:opacity protein-like surface antigen
MRRKLLGSIGSLASVALLVAPVHAQDGSPLQVDLGVSTGVAVLSSTTGLGNAFHATDVPGTGPLVGVHAGVVVLDGHLGVEAAFRDAFSSLRSGNGSAQLPAVRLQALWYFLTEGAVRPYGLLGVGYEGFVGSKSVCDANGQPAGCLYYKKTDWDNAFFAGVGAKIPLTYRLALRADGRYLLADGRPGTSKYANNFEAQVGLTYSLGGRPEDADNDGIPDDKDKCPTQAEDKDGFQDEDGCPELDNDGDGIPDVQDKCPNEAEDYDKFQDDDGCPDPDNDGDGIPDVKDKCPDKAETKNGFQDDDGCPDEVDSDGDGVPDSKDKCPKEKEDKDGFQDDDGCPDPDNDGDGIPDARDKCPNQAETRNGIADEDGCPDEMPANVKKLFDGPVTSLEFKGIVLQKGSDAHLEPLLELLLEHEKLQVEIGVQASDASDGAKKVAEQRATAVRAWFEDKGIEPGRIFAVATAAAPDAKPVKDSKAPAKPPVTFKLVSQAR